MKKRIIVITGKKGSGKTSLAKIIAGQDSDYYNEMNETEFAMLRTINAATERFSRLTRFIIVDEVKHINMAILGCERFLNDLIPVYSKGAVVDAIQPTFVIVSNNNFADYFIHLPNSLREITFTIEL